MALSEPIDQLGTSRGPKKDGLRIGHLNAHGMKKATKIRDITNFIRNRKFDILAISETWLEESDSSDDILISGYHVPIRANRPPGGDTEDGYGGLVVYICENIDYDLVFAGSWVFQKNVDMSTQNIHIVVKSDRSGTVIPKIQISALYIPPRQKRQNNRLLCRLSDQNDHTNVVVLGDVNINQFKQSKKQTKAVESLGFCQLINEITRPSTRTLLDHIYVQKCQVNNFISESGVIQCSISDHDFIFCTINDQFLQRDFSTPKITYKTIVKSSGHAKAEDELGNLCQTILHQIVSNKDAKLEPDMSGVGDRHIAHDDYDFIINKYEEWHKIFWQEAGETKLVVQNRDIFFVNQNSKLELLWLAIGMDKDDTLVIGDDKKFVFLDYDKWIEKTKDNHRQSLQEHSKGGGRGAVAVHYRISPDDARIKTYLMFRVSELKCRHDLECSDGMIGCEIPKKDVSSSTFYDVLDLIIGGVKDIPGLRVTDWEPFGNKYVFDKKFFDKSDVQYYIKEEHSVDMLG